MKKKGFTLIELLAVIVILAVIAVIATPAVLNIIEDSKKSAAEASARSIVGAAKADYIAAGGTEAEYGSYGNNSKGPITLLKQLKSDTSSWNKSINPRLIEAREIATITGNSGWTAGGSDYYFHDNTQTRYTGDAGTNRYAWLFDNTYNCINWGCNVVDSSNYGYWTNTAYSGYSHLAWHVHCDGSLKFDSVKQAGYNGVRPVITVLKSIIS